SGCDVLGLAVVLDEFGVIAGLGEFVADLFHRPVRSVAAARAMEENDGGQGAVGLVGDAMEFNDRLVVECELASGPFGAGGGRGDGEKKAGSRLARKAADSREEIETRSG